MSPRCSRPVSHSSSHRANRTRLVSTNSPASCCVFAFAYADCAARRLSSGQGDAIIAERTAAIFDRLAKVDDAAHEIADAETAAAPGQAWAAVFADSVEHGIAGVAAKRALYRADASSYDLVAAAEREVDVAAIDRMLHVLA